MTPTATMPNPAQIRHRVAQNAQQIHLNRMKMEHHAPGTSERARLRRENERLHQANVYWCREYRKQTGQVHTWFVLPVHKQETEEEARERKRAERHSHSHAKRRENLLNVLAMGQVTYTRLHGHVHQLYDQATEIGFSMFLRHMVRILGGSNVHTLLVMRDSTLPRIATTLTKAQRCLREGDLDGAEDELLKAASDIKSVESVIARWYGTESSGAEASEITIKFYAAVLMAVVAGPGVGGQAAATVKAEMALGAAGAAGMSGGELLIKKLDGQDVSGQDMADAAIDIASGALGPAAGQGLVRAWVRAAGRKLPGILAARALEKWQGPVLTFPQKVAAMKAATRWCEARIRGITAAQISVLAAKLKAHLRAKKPPDWSFWSSLIAPLVGGVPSAVIKEAVEGAQKGAS
jgi:hypothetical protein